SQALPPCPPARPCRCTHRSTPHFAMVNRSSVPCLLRARLVPVDLTKTCGRMIGLPPSRQTLLSIGLQEQFVARDNYPARRPARRGTPIHEQSIQILLPAAEIGRAHV